MVSVVGIGNAGCALADKMSQYPQYAIYKIDVGLTKGKGNFPITRRPSPEEYEEKFSKRIFSDLKKIKGDVLIILGGGGSISSCALRVMEALKENRTEVVYIQPAHTFLSEGGTRLHNVVGGVLQEYARSGLVHRLYLISNAEIERVVGRIPVAKYYDTLNNIISSTVHMINVYKNSVPTLSNIKEVEGILRISTIGIGTLDNTQDQMFFPLNYSGEKIYYFAINEEQLDADQELLARIKLRVKQEDSSVATSFGVYPTSYSENYIYILSNTKIIQGVDYDE